MLESAYLVDDHISASLLAGPLYTVQTVVLLRIDFGQEGGDGCYAEEVSLVMGTGVVIYLECCCWWRC